jgi:hypothetical protein
VDAELEEEFHAGAVAALRRRAARQRKRAADWTVTTESGVAIKGGEAAIAERIAAVLDQTADEFEAEAKS